MEVKPGYKQTEVGVIPEDWDVKPLGHLVKLQAGYSFRSENFSDIGTPVIRISDIQDGIVNVDSAVCHPPFKIDDDFVVKNGDFLVAMSGATTGKVGVFRSPKPAYQNQRVGRFVVRDESRTSQLFVGQLVRSSRFGSRLSVLLEQGAQPNVSGRQIESLLFPVPTQPPEQRAIATALSDVDGLLGGLDRLIAKKRDLKQAAMQQLLTGQTRLPGFHGEWEVKRLGDVIHLIRGGIYGEEKPRAGLSASSVATTAHIEMDDTWNNKEMPVRYFTAEKLRDYAIVEGDLIVVKSSGSAASIQSGKLGFINTERAGKFVFSNFLMLLRPTAVLPRFLYFYLCSHNVKKLLPTLVEASTYPNIRLVDYLAVQFLVPPLPEQTAIAEVLTEMDGELAVLEQRLEKTRALKQAMMQELLTGRIRLV